VVWGWEEKNSEVGPLPPCLGFYSSKDVHKVVPKVGFLLPNKAYLEAEAAKDGVISLDSFFG
jgi:hypothetical protein